MNVQQLGNRFLLLGPRLSNLLLSSSRCYAVKAKKVGTTATKVGKAGPVVEKVKFTVEKDPHKLVNYCCGSNIYTEGEDVKLKPESEYPDWLWDIHIGPKKKLEDMDPNTKEYWRRVRKMALNQHNRLEKTKRRHLY